MNSSKKTKTSGRNSKKLSKQSRAIKTKPTDRCIYEYWDGTRTRRIDPLEVQHSLNSRDGFDLDTDFKLATSQLVGDKENVAALRRIIDAVRAAFSIPVYDG